VIRADEYGVEEEVTILQPALSNAYAKHNVLVPDVLCKWLRPHQREGVQFMYECVMSLRDYRGCGCILAGKSFEEDEAIRFNTFLIEHGRGEDSLHIQYFYILTQMLVSYQR
jgi:hypothetical protein